MKAIDPFKMSEKERIESYVADLKPSDKGTRYADALDIAYKALDEKERLERHSDLMDRIIKALGESTNVTLKYLSDIQNLPIHGEGYLKAQDVFDLLDKLKVKP